MRSDERRAVLRVAVRAFGPGVLLLFGFGDHCVVAVDGERILGAAVAKRSSVRIRTEERTVGILSWVMTDPDAQGAGIGEALLASAHEWFDEQGCDLLLAIIEGTNSSSYRRFASRGYRRLRPVQQFRQWGAATLKLWLKLPHIADIAHFVWARDDHDGAVDDAGPVVVAGHIAVGWLLNAAVVLLLLLRVGFRPILGPQALVAAAVVPGFVVGLRSAVLALVARAGGVPVRYRMWESAYPLSVVIAAVFGGLFVVPGSVYPADPTARAQSSRRPLGLSAVLSTITMAGAAALLAVPSIVAALPPVFSLATSLTRTALLTLLIFDGVVPIFPFSGFNARRAWDWSPIAWLLGAAATVAAWVLQLFV